MATTPFQNINNLNSQILSVSKAGAGSVQTFTALAANANQVVQLTADQSGMTLVVNLDDAAAGNINFVLPPVQTGIKYTFVMRGPVGGAAGDIRIYPNGYTQAAGISAANSPASTMNVNVYDIAGSACTAAESAVGNDTANGQGGLNFQGGQAVGGDQLYLRSAAGAATAGTTTPQWTGVAYTNSATGLVAS